MKIFCFLILNILSTPVFAQANDPFEVINIGASILSADDMCQLINDKNTRILKDILVQDGDIGKGWIAYRHKSTWFGFEMPASARHAEFQFADIDKDNVQELAVFSTRDEYGSGGGTTTYITTIYKFDTAVWQIMNIEYGYAEEMFGREYNNGANFLHVCKQKITVDYGEIRIAPASGEGSYDSRKSNYRETCRNTITPGIYTFRNGKVQRIGKYKRAGSR